MIGDGAPATVSVTAVGETDAELTAFYFDVQPNELRESMVRFGQFFEAPLFKWNPGCNPM